jgi:hypothetical protein
MAMVLEYPMNIIILTVVVLVVIGIMFSFRDRITNICIFPPCEEEIICDVKPAVVTETAVTQDIIDKYCKMCLGKNRDWECKEDSLCYVVNIQSAFNPFGITPSMNDCEVKCNRAVTSFFVQYNFLDKKIYITC